MNARYVRVRRLVYSLLSSFVLLVGGLVLHRFALPNQYGYHLNGATDIGIVLVMALAMWVLIVCLTPRWMLARKQ